MKTLIKYFKITLAGSLLLLACNVQAQTKTNVAVTQYTGLPVMTLPNLAMNGTKGNVKVYPLKVSATDTLFFANQSLCDYVKKGLSTANVTSLTKVTVAVRGRGIRPPEYGGRPCDYYYYCNAVNDGYFNVTGLTTRQNTTFSVSYNATGRYYSVIRHYNTLDAIEYNDPIEAISQSLANDLANFTGTEYLNKSSLLNRGGFFFFLSRPAVTPPPPPLSPLKVSGKTLTDHHGKAAILYGVNTAVYHSGYINDLAAVSNAIKNNSRSNCARLSWSSSKAIMTTAANNVNNPDYVAPTFYTYANLDSVLKTYTNNHILPILMLHDLSDLYLNTNAAFNQYVVPFWTDPAVIAVLKKYQNNLIINLQNEFGATWNGTTGANFIAAFTPLMTSLRNAGIHVPIMIDAPDGGTNYQFLLDNGAALINADPDKNVLFSVHTYWSQENGLIANCPADYASKIQAIASSSLPFVLGEVSDWCVEGDNGTDHESTPPVNFACPGKTAANKYAIDYDAILTQAMSSGIGFIAWSWYQDGLIVRNIYNGDNGTAQSTDAHAGSWPADILSSTKKYGLNNPAISNPFFN